MAKIIIACTGLKGILLSSVEIYRRLTAAGHEVYLGCATDQEKFIEAYKVNYLQLPSHMDIRLPEWEVKSNILTKPFRLIWRYLNYNTRRKKGLEALASDEMAAIFKAHSFDLLLCDFELHEAVLAAHMVNLTTIIVNPRFSYLPSDSTPPIDSFEIPNSQKQFTNEWKYIQQKHQKRERKRRILNGFLDRKKLLLLKAEEIQFPKEQWLPYLNPTPFVYQNIPIINLVPKELEFAMANTQNMTYVGPMIPKIDTIEDRDSLYLILSERKKTGSTIILVMNSTMNEQADESLFEKMYDYATKNKHWEIVFTSAPKKMKDIPNFHTPDWIQTTSLLPYTDITICHGGINIINECIAHEVPMLFHAKPIHDRPGNVARLLHAGLGKSLSTEQNLEEQIIETIQDSSLKKQYKKYKNLIEKYDYNKILENTIDLHLK